jgi:beta-hydroxylase
MVRHILEYLIANGTRDGHKAFFDVRDFAWAAELESKWRVIRGELDAVLVHRDRIPNFQDLSEDQSVLTEGDQWKTFFLFGYGHRVEQNIARCPNTARLLQKIPGLKTAMFSILAPGKHIPPHRGLYNGVLRYHLGLLIPPPENSCRISVKNEVRSWAEGKSLIFDDSHMHEAWNDSNSVRVVLFVDFVRPLPFPLSILNRIMIGHISRTPFIIHARDRARIAAGGAME